MRNRSKLLSSERYDEYRSRSSSSITPKSTTKKNSSKKKPAQKTNPIKKKHSKNAFAGGKNNQNFRTNKGMVSVKEKEVGKSSSKDDEEWEDECEDEGENLSSSHQTANKKKKINRNKTSQCWKFFKEINGVHPIKKTQCSMNLCVVKVDGKECGAEFVAHTSTSHLNEHLYVVHEMEKFRPKKLNSVTNVQEINELVAKFIITSNSSFRIVENKYLMVIYK